jgi:hypothetical protein
MKECFTVPNTKTLAKACLRELRWGYETNGCFVHRISGLMGKLYPKWMMRRITEHYSYLKMIKRHRND